MSLPVRDLLITATEINDHHGVGILLRRFFPDSSEFVCVRTTSLYRGEEPFGAEHHDLCSRFLTIKETREHLARILSLYQIRRILCVPYYREEFVHAVLAKEMTGAPLCTYLMDDQNVFARKVPDHRVGALLAASDLRFGISAELALAYERKYGLAFHVLPPVVEPASLVPCYWHPEPSEPLRAAMIGNVWSAAQLRQLRRLLPAADLEIDWYGKGPEASWLEGTAAEWEADGLHVMGHLPEDVLVVTLASYPFIVLPSGSLDAEDENPSFARLSLPSRLFFCHSRTDVPILVLGSAQGAAGRFVTRNGTGACAGFDAAVVRDKVRLLTAPERHREFRRNVRSCAPNLSLRDGGEWLWRALARRAPEPAPFENLFPHDYLREAEEIITGSPAVPSPNRRLPAADQALSSSDLPSLAILRRSHFSTLRQAAPNLANPEEADITAVSAAVASYVLRATLKPGDNFLFIGNYVPADLSAPEGVNGWRFADVVTWQQAGYAGDPSLLIALNDGAAHPPQFPQFNAIVSTGWCGQLGADPHALEGLALYLEACTLPDGWNFHGFAAVLHNTYFWVGPAHAYLQTRFCGPDGWPDLDELLETEDLFVMSECAYDRTWKAAVQRAYAELGKPLVLGVGWHKVGS
ncbi:MAG: hypothetical protein RLZ98_261 [Pseudomonadota bacterium]|jgi:hypothetical protein